MTSRRPNHAVSFTMLVVLNANGFEPMEERTRDTNSRTVFGPGPVGPAELYSSSIQLTESNSDRPRASGSKPPSFDVTGTVASVSVRPLY